MSGTCPVVDDSRAARKLARRILEANGYVITEAANGGVGILLGKFAQAGLD